MQGLADGYFVIPATLSDYLAGLDRQPVDEGHAAFADAERELTERLDRLLAVQGQKTADSIHRELGLLLWNHCGMARNEQGLTQALEQIPVLREEFWGNVRVPGTGQALNTELDKAWRVADFLEFAELMVRDALDRRESCGGHFREESQTADNEALRDDEHYCHAAVWEHAGEGQAPRLHKEPLTFEHVPLTQRSYT
jgi:succinate dehydrogenase / fumarate reductase flavoprotein subunit